MKKPPRRDYEKMQIHYIINSWMDKDMGKIYQQQKTHIIKSMPNIFFRL